MITLQKGIEGNYRTAYRCCDEKEEAEEVFVNRRLVPAGIIQQRPNILAYVNNNIMKNSQDDRYPINQQDIAIIRESVKAGFCLSHDPVVKNVFWKIMEDINKKMPIEYKCPEGYKLYPAPPDDLEQRWFLYISGESGAGKSYLLSHCCVSYKSTRPQENKIYLFSAKPEDKSLDTLEYVIRVKMEDMDKFIGSIPTDYDDKPVKKKVKLRTGFDYEPEEDTEKPPPVRDIKEFANSFFCFDDIEHITPPPLRKKVHAFKNWLVEVGRSYHIDIAMINHVQRNYNQTKIDLNEFSDAFIFPSRMNGHHMTVFLRNHCGISQKNASRIISMKTDYWVGIHKRSPMTVFSEDEMFMIHKEDQ